MRLFTADLQMHSCLSPCGSLESSPARIARSAREKGLDLIALTDHNTAGNCPTFADAVDRTSGLAAFFGLEVTSAEEVHLICLFADAATAVSFGDLVRSRLPARENDPDRFGDQPIVDAEDTIVGTEHAFLAGATSMPLDAIARETHERGGVIIASHIDRPINSLFSQLGMWPENATLDGCDLSPRATTATWRPLVPPHVPFIRTSDAHYPEDIGRQRTALRMAGPTFTEFRRALKAQDDRAVVIDQSPNGAT